MAPFEEFRSALTSPFYSHRGLTLDLQLPDCEYGVQSGIDLTSGQKDLGDLEIFPTELIIQMISYLDLRSLAKLRFVNKYAHRFVASLPKLKAVITHAQKALYAMHITGTDQFITLETLYSRLCTAECEVCGDFGIYLSLIACKRVCYICFTEDRSFYPLRTSHGMGQYGLSQREIKKLPYLTCYPGHYAANCHRPSNHIRGNLKLYDRETVKMAAMIRYGSIDQMKAAAEVKRVQRMENYYARRQDYWSGRRARRAHRPATSDPQDKKADNPLRFASVVTMPWLNKKTNETEWGFRCMICYQRWGARPRVMHRDRLFTADGFVHHMEQCGLTEDGYHIQE